MKALVCFLMALVGTNAIARSIQQNEGYFEVEPGVSLYAKVTPGAPDGPIILELNGLTQDMDHWQTGHPYLIRKNATIVSVDLALQGRSMVKQLKENFTMFNPIVPPIVMRGGLWSLPPTFKAVPIDAQARYVSKLLKNLGITKPVILSGLSYGGGLGLQFAADYPEQVQAGVLEAPYAFPLPDLDDVLRMLTNTTRTTYPQWRMVPFDDVYDIYLRAIIFMTYPSAEPEVNKWSPPFQTIAASELVRGIRHMSYQKLFERLKVPIHLVVAGDDKYIPREKLDEFWSKVPSKVKGSFLEIKGVEHKINESVGPYLASWVYELATNPDYLRNPGSFVGVPQDGVATEVGGSRVVVLEKAVPSQDLLINPDWDQVFGKIRKSSAAEAIDLMSKGNPLPGQLNTGE